MLDDHPFAHQRETDQQFWARKRKEEKEPTDPFAHQKETDQQFFARIRKENEKNKNHE